MTMPLISRFEGEDGKRRINELLKDQSLVGGNSSIAKRLLENGELLSIAPQEVIIEQGAIENDIFFILAGSFDILVNGRKVATRQAGTHVGEMAAIQPSQRRSATVVATEEAVILKLTEPKFVQIANDNPEIWKQVGRELARRLEQRNQFVTTTRDRIRVFIISSSESLGVAREIQNQFNHDDFVVDLWANGVFTASTYTLESLEYQLDRADFAIAIASSDDVSLFRGTTSPVPRDNVIFELGFFMGRLGRFRSILVMNRANSPKLPSDLDGLTLLTYSWSGDKKELAASLGPTCNELRDIIVDRGPNN